MSSMTLTVVPAPLVRTDKPEIVAQALERASSVSTAAVAMRVMQRLIDTTPVDTGHAKSNWIASVGFRHTTIAGSKEQVDTSLQQASMDRLRFYDISQGLIFIVNNVAYIRALNAGHSRKAPAGFVEMATNDPALTFGITTIRI